MSLLKPWRRLVMAALTFARKCERGNLVEITTEMSNERFAITLEVPGGDVPAVQRLRAALKHLLRGFQIRCVALSRPVEPTGGPAVIPPPGVAPAEPGAAFQQTE